MQRWWISILFSWKGVTTQALNPLPNNWRYVQISPRDATGMVTNPCIWYTKFSLNVFCFLKLFIADTVIETLPGINGSHDVVFHTSPLTKYMEIHRVEFRDARKITFQSQHNNTQPEVFEIDHAYCQNRTLCVIESCNLTSCKLMTQALDPRRAVKSSRSNPRIVTTNLYLAFVAVLLLSVINNL